MKKTIALLAAAVLLLLCAACGSSTTSGEAATVASGEVIQISEKLFLAQVNDIWLNQQDYIGKTLEYEGMFTIFHSDSTGKDYASVYRSSPGCCGADGQCGFEVAWPAGQEKPWPAENDWVAVKGTLGNYEEEGFQYLQVILDSMEVKAERGLEFVSA
ncbi:MAG: hypothetical protein LBR73_09150 [Oscillospiraceae bacterium]|jgi:uncharacterized membrane protein YcgQ (UPF0703/DUF1980 family)|nr:hypothetical protein [Oscillospiraceae bacterium]